MNKKILIARGAVAVIGVGIIIGSCIYKGNIEPDDVDHDDADFDLDDFDYSEDDKEDE